MSEATIDHARLAQITHLDHGAHDPKREAGMCAMEAVAWIAGEPWSDHPACACPVIAAFMRSWNDGLPDEDRTAILLPLVPRLVGTKGSAALESRRATMAADWLVRAHTPAWLRVAGLTAQADALTALPEITDFANTPSLRGPLQAARTDAAAAWAAAGDAARDAARDAAWAAAWDAAWDAAGAAAGAAAKAKLEPTRLELQRSALALVERMIAEPDPIKVASPTHPPLSGRGAVTTSSSLTALGSHPGPPTTGGDANGGAMPLVIDSFAGGGGASEGIRAALGRDPDYALNHDRLALAMHRSNHPGTHHIEEDVWNVDAVGLCAGRPVGLLWMSPD